MTTSYAPTPTQTTIPAGRPADRPSSTTPVSPPAPASDRRPWRPARLVRRGIAWLAVNGPASPPRAYLPGPNGTPLWIEDGQPHR